MFCRYCGNQLPDEAKFCPKCGKITEAAQAAAEPAAQPVAESVVETAVEPVAQPVYETVDISNDIGCCEQAPAVDEQKKKNSAGEILKYGIMSLVFAYVLPFVGGILGIAFAKKAKALAEKFTAEYGELEGGAKVGKILAIPGLILGILNIVGWAFYLFYIFVYAILLGSISSLM